MPVCHIQVSFRLSLSLFSLHLTESRDGKCPAPEDLVGCGHSRTSSYASQQSKLSGIKHICYGLRIFVDVPRLPQLCHHRLQKHNVYANCMKDSHLRLASYSRSDDCRKGSKQQRDVLSSTLSLIQPRLSLHVEFFTDLLLPCRQRVSCPLMKLPPNGALPKCLSWLNLLSCWIYLNTFVVELSVRLQHRTFPLFQHVRVQPQEEPLHWQRLHRYRQHSWTQRRAGEGIQGLSRPAWTPRSYLRHHH